jgi:hypothetical protein
MLPTAGGKADFKFRADNGFLCDLISRNSCGALGKRLVEWCLRAEIRTGVDHHKQTTQNTRGRIVNHPQLSSLAEVLTDMCIDDILFMYINIRQGAQIVDQI